MSSRAALKKVADAVKTGHRDPASLRELLIATTSSVTCDVAMVYFRSHLHDERLLEALVEIALEGEDMGDAPWAAANVIAEFPAQLLKTHEAALRQLSEEPWMYLNGPAKKALEKISSAS